MLKKSLQSKSLFTPRSSRERYLGKIHNNIVVISLICCRKIEARRICFLLVPFIFFWNKDKFLSISQLILVSLYATSETDSCMRYVSDTLVSCPKHLPHRECDHFPDVSSLSSSLALFSLCSFILFLFSRFLGSGPKGPMSCRTQG